MLLRLKYNFQSMAGVLLALSLVACGDNATVDVETAEAITVRALTLTPTDPILAQTYETTCKSCHADPSFGAPLTGDSSAWAPRLDKGMDILLDHTINGFNGMPPLGMCIDCSAEDFTALIEFMATAE